MKRSTNYLTIALALSTLLSVSARAGIPVSVETIAPGYDLYQLSSELFLESAASSDDIAAGRFGGEFDFPAIGFFDDFDVFSEPLGQFDFGNGAVDVGLADTIVRRDQPVTSPGDGSTVTVPIELVALSLVSVDPVDLGNGSSDLLYVSLNPNLASTGQYEINFAQFPDPVFVGDYSASLTVNFQTHIGSPNGPVHEVGTVNLNSSFGSVPFSHFPEGVSPFRAPDKLIDDVNFFLDITSQDQDFFQLGLPLVLTNDDGGDVSFTELALEHANSDDPGDSPGNPVLPDGMDGNSFVFNDAPGSGWFDPPLANGYVYETDGLSSFVSVFLPGLGLVPDGDGLYLVSSIHGDVVVGAGTSHTFSSPVDAFTVTGIDPAVDGGDPLAFPTFLIFDSFSNTFTQTPIPIPEPLTLGLAMIGAARVLSARRR